MSPSAARRPARKADVCTSDVGLLPVPALLGSLLTGTRTALLAVLAVLFAAPGAVTLAATEPPFGGTTFISPDVITEADPTALRSVVYTGRGERVIWDYRVFDCSARGRSSAAIGSTRASRSTRARVRSTSAAGSSKRSCSTRQRTCRLMGWSRTPPSGARRRTQTARSSRPTRGTFPTREDVAESILPYFAVRLRPGSLTPGDRAAIEATIPNRLAAFDAHAFDWSPYGVVVPALPVAAALMLAALLSTITRPRGSR